jgi:DNA invertase Pin-like site-specific DNA recombinase
MKVALYARTSTADQDGSSQLERLREWARREGHDVVLERTDVASGRLVRRPGAGDVLAEARGHHIQAVAVVKVDRWARSVQHLAATVAELRELGVEFVAVDQGLRVSRDRTDPTATLILHVLASVAEWEGSIIRERTKEALASLRARGVRLGRPPRNGIWDSARPVEERRSRIGGGSETTVSRRRGRPPRPPGRGGWPSRRVAAVYGSRAPGVSSR